MNFLNFKSPSQHVSPFAKRAFIVQTNRLIYKIKRVPYHQLTHAMPNDDWRVNLVQALLVQMSEMSILATCLPSQRKRQIQKDNIELEHLTN